MSFQSGSNPEISSANSSFLRSAPRLQSVPVRKGFHTSASIPTAKAHGGGENQQVAEDAEELGQIQEQRQGVQLRPSHLPDHAPSDASFLAVVHISADKCSFSSLINRLIINFDPRTLKLLLICSYNFFLTQLPPSGGSGCFKLCTFILSSAPLLLAIDVVIDIWTLFSLGQLAVRPPCLCLSHTHTLVRLADALIDELVSVISRQMMCEWICVCRVISSLLLLLFSCNSASPITG